MQGWQRMGKMEDNCANVILCVTMKGRHRTSKEKEEQSKHGESCLEWLQTTPQTQEQEEEFPLLGQGENNRVKTRDHRLW